MIKESVHQEYIILNMYASDIRASKYMKWKLTKLKGEVDKSTIITVNFNYFQQLTEQVEKQKFSLTNTYQITIAPGLLSLRGTLSVTQYTQNELEHLK